MECEAFDLGCYWSALFEQIKLGFTWMLEQILSALIAVLNAIPVPSFMQNVNFSLPDGVLWFAAVLQLDYGAGVMVAAWLLRFSIRRLPFIG